MKTDLIAKSVVGQGSQIAINHSKGHLNGLLLVGIDNLSYQENKLTVKVQDRKRTHVLSNSIGLEYLSTITDLIFGERANGGTPSLLATLVTELASARNGNTGAAVTSAYADSLQGYFKGLDMVYIPLGSITLEDDVEMSVIYDHGYSFGTTARIYTVSHTVEPDNYIQYDKTKDINTRANAVREIFVDAGSPLLDKDLGLKALDVQIDVEDDDTYLFDSAGMIGITNIFNKVEGPQHDRFLKLFAENGALPANVRVKLTDADVSLDPELVFVKEIIPERVSKSTISNAVKMANQVEKLENDKPEVARAYRHAGVIPNSEELKEAVASAKS